MSLTPYNSGAGTDLVRWAEEASQVHHMAQALATTSFVPKTMQGRPDEIAAQILYGREVNMSPMVALQQIHVIDGRPSLSALSMRGMAQSAGVRFRLDDTTETRCKYSALAPGDAAWTTVTWTMDRAKKLGLVDKANWRKQPQAMLIARATSELCRLVAAPLFLGLSYSTEELRDGSDDVAALYETVADRTPEPPQAETPPARVMRRDPIKASASVPQQEPAPWPEPAQPALNAAAETEPSDMVTANTRKALMARFNDADITDRAVRLSYVSDLLEREIGSVNEVTETEALRVLEQLRADSAAPVVQGDESSP